MLDKTLYTIGDHAVTAAELLVALLIVVLAWVAVRVTRVVYDKRKKANPERASRLYSSFLLISYFTWLVALGLALPFTGLDLTFLLAGGAALLVGLGLGIQSTFNDIISGIIILFEGTIRVGDVLEVEGLVGRVTEIKLRTSTVFSRDGMNVIVPNHRFINENVVNWSHNRSQTRFCVDVGVAYGSDAELVRSVLLECARKDRQIIHDDPELPVSARLINFGESSLDFRLLFWSVNIFYIEQTKSDLRFAILKAFAERGISIPFPQRDLHIRTDVRTS